MGKIHTLRNKPRGVSPWSALPAPRRGQKPRRNILMELGLFLLLAATLGMAAGIAPSLPGSDRVPLPDAAQRLDRSFSNCGSGRRTDCVLDGDTFHVDGEKIRIADIDAPELFSPRCSREAMLAGKAQRRLRTLLNAGPIDLRRPAARDRDVYGRKLRNVYRNGRSLGETLVAEGLARPWRGYGESWCG